MSRKINAWVFPGLLLAGLGFVVYSNSFLNSFHFDDLSFILGNDAITKITDLRPIWDYWPPRFIGFLSFAVSYKIGKFSVFGYHLFNLALHILTAILVFIFTTLTLSTASMRSKEIAKHKEVLAFFAAAIFLTHPLQTQAVNYIFQRITILAAFFYLASLCLYIRARFLIQDKQKAGIFYYALSLVTAFTGMFTKEIFFTFPLMLLLYDFCFLRVNNKWEFKYTVPFLAMLPVIPLVLFSLTSFGFTPVYKSFLPSLPGFILNFLTQCRVVMTYLRLLVLPFNQNLDYDYVLVKNFLDAGALMSLGFLATVFIMGLRIFSKFRLPAFCIFWVFITLTVESAFFPLVGVIYEHRFYLPMAGASIFIVCVLYYLLGRNRLKTMIVALSLVIFFGSFLSYNRNKVWKDEISLWSDVIAKSPKKIRGYNERGLAYLEKGQHDRALVDFNTVIELDPGLADGFYNRATIYREKGQYDKAILDYNQALKIAPGYVKALINRGLVYYLSQQYEKAIADYKQAIEYDPLETVAYSNLAYLYYHAGKKVEAQAVLKKAAVALRSANK
jgi:tetratricopeptide (TPR) repeat protein